MFRVFSTKHRHYLWPHLVILLFLVACGSPTTSGVSIEIGFGDANQTVTVGGPAVKFEATVTGTTETVRWSLQGPGSIPPNSTGLSVFYTPPTEEELNALILAAEATATLTAKAGSASKDFIIEILPRVNSAPTITEIILTNPVSGTVEQNSGDVAGNATFAVIDAEDALANLSVSATSNNQAIVTDASLNSSCTDNGGISCVLSFTINTATAGTATITVKVTDTAGDFAEKSVSVTVIEATGGIVVQADNRVILRPNDFTTGGSVSINLPNLGANESIAVIPVHASQDLNVDSLNYQLEVANISPREPQARAASRALLSNTQEQVLRDMSKARAEYQRASLESIQASGAQFNPQGFNDNCPAPYVVNVTQCDFFVLGNLRDTTLLFESANALFFVDNTAIGEFTQAQLADQARRYEDELLPLMQRYFTAPQDFDSNGKIFIVMSSIPFFGYVTSRDFFTTDIFPDSNEGDIFYAALPSDFTEFFTVDEWFSLWLPSTLVHEVKHLVALGKRFVDGSQFEDAWWEEGSAVGAEELSPYPSALSGYAQGQARAALEMPQGVRLINETDPDLQGIWYGYNFLYLWWLAEQVGHDNFWQPWVLGPETGVANLEKNISNVYPNFAESMLNWALALMFDHTDLVSGFDYDKLNLRDGSWTPLAYMPLQNTTGQARSIAYHVGQGQGANATVTISSSNANPYFIVVRFTGALPF